MGCSSLKSHILHESVHSGVLYHEKRTAFAIAQPERSQRLLRLIEAVKITCVVVEMRLDLFLVLASGVDT